MALKPTRLLATVLACGLVASGLAHADRAAPAADIARAAGQQVYGKWCSDCHSTATGPGSLALQRKYQGDPPAILIQRSDLTPDYVRLIVRHGISFMPSFRKTEISDAELAALGAYLAPPQRPIDGATKRP